MEKDQIFDLLFSKKCEGVYMDVENDPDLSFWGGLINDLETCIGFVNRGISDAPEIVIGLMSSAQVGAIASKYADKYYIGIYLGTFMVLQSMFCRILTSPLVLSYYGESSKEVVKKMPNPHVSSLFKLLHKNNNAIDAFPNDPIRIKLSNFLTYLAMRYLVLHENGHIIHGHIDYLQQINNQQVLEALPSNATNTQLDPIHSQVLEDDADAYALNSSLRYLMSILHGHIPEQERFVEFYSNDYYKNKFIAADFEQVFLLHCFACQTIFRLFNAIIIDQSELNQRSHLPPNFRLLHFSSGSALWIERSFNNLQMSEQEPYENTIIKIVAEASKELDKAFGDISFMLGVVESHWTSVRFALDQPEYHSMIQYEWNEVRPLIEPFAYVPLHPVWE